MIKIRTLALASTCSIAVTADEKPMNIIWIGVDDLRPVGWRTTFRKQDRR
jgi:hypothetical protein